MYNALELEKTAAVLRLPIFYTPMLVRCSRPTQTYYLYLQVENLINMLWFSQIVSTCTINNYLVCNNIGSTAAAAEKKCCGVPLALVYSALFSDDVCDIFLSFDWLGNDEIYLNKNDQNHFFCQVYCKSTTLTRIILLYCCTR